MFVYPENYQKAKCEFEDKIKELKKSNYTVFTKSHELSNTYSINKYIIKSIKPAKNRLILSAGLHGIEGYVGHAAIMTFLTYTLHQLREDTEVIIYHVLNPFGMDNFRRTNAQNVDLNRNFTNNDFSSTNDNYQKLHDFFTPKQYLGYKTANLKFYSSVVNKIRKFGVTTLKEATLLGQNTLQQGLYFSGVKTQPETNYLFQEMDLNITNIQKVIWVDLHSGYGPRYQMSIVNSRYEKSQTTQLKDSINYPLILGLEENDFYDIDGDMVEKIYQRHKDKKSSTLLYATCFEFGTLGETTKNNIESLKAMIFENSSFFEKQTTKFKQYSKELICEQFMPSEAEWRQKAESDFLIAITSILEFFHFSR